MPLGQGLFDFADHATAHMLADACWQSHGRKKGVAACFRSCDSAPMELELPSTPFVLIDDARADGRGEVRLYRNPIDIAAAVRLDEVVPALERLRDARADGLHVAGFLGYEAGYALERRLSALDPRRGEDDPPLLWFGLFEREEIWPAGALKGISDSVAAPVTPAIGIAEYETAFAAIQDKIVAGDIYQANLTFQSMVDVVSGPVPFYKAIRPYAHAGHGALLFTGEHWLLSFSPEQFFALNGDRLSTRPMKGTALRDEDPERDAANAFALRQDPKQRAENLMIVDLLRNDLSRIAVAGSVEVPALFTVESYPTVHQMTSTVNARLLPGLDAVDALMALFPCGSITGAPKIRAMEILHDIEAAARGPYTGSIGAIDSAGNAAFNVAIRTICVKNGHSRGTIGLGSGLVADSRADSEWRECLDKARFLAPDITDQAHGGT